MIKRSGGSFNVDHVISGILLVVFVVLVAYAAKARIDIQDPGEHAGPTRPHHPADLGRTRSQSAGG